MLIHYFYIFKYKAIENVGIRLNGRYDYAMDTDKKVMTMSENPNWVEGFWPDGKEKDFYIKNIESSTLDAAHLDSSNLDGTFMLHVFPVHYFCPVLTTGEDVRTEETYCEHKGESSWAKQGWKGRVLAALGLKWRTRIIKLKRRIFG